ncbi:hypothetical protein [Tropicimonas sp. S265A]|uniref:hypothetical protein n=1 Tax=Tropicimonas sp. S265A TaxID=3415134 RepID=UPI003C79E11B
MPLHIQDPEVLLAAAPWNLDATRLAEAPIDVPTMLAPEERRFYHWVGEEWARDAGAIVELGAFAGGGTARLAAGVAARGGTQKVHAYDRFGANEQAKRRLLYPAGVAPFEGEDILGVAQGFLAPWADRVELHPGEIEELGWQGDDIEVLVVDAGKKATTLDQIARQFYGALIPGRSLLIQQDFLHWKQPWLTAQMSLLGDCLRPVGFARDHTVAFLCTAQITPTRLQAARLVGLSDETLIAHIERMRDALADWGFSDRFDRSIAALIASPNVRTAWQMRKPRG